MNFLESMWFLRGLTGNSVEYRSLTPEYVRYSTLPRMTLEHVLIMSNKYMFILLLEVT